MKKVLAFVLALSLVLSLAAFVPSFAGEGGTLCIDACSTKDAGGNILKSFSQSDNDYGVVLGASYIHVQGWFKPNEEMSAIGYQTDDGAVVYTKADSSAIMFEDTAIYAPLESNLPKRYNFDAPIEAGTHDLKMVIKYPDDSTYVCKTIHYVNEELAEDWANVTAGSGGVGLWLNDLGESATATFTATDSFSAIKLPIFWSSRVDTGCPVTFSFSLYKFRYNTENSLNFTPVATKSYTPEGDNSEPIELTFEGGCPKGQYVLEVKVTNIVKANPGDNCYVVLPVPGNTDFASYTSDDAQNPSFNFSLKSYVPDSIYGEIPEETEAPDPTTLVAVSYDTFYCDSTLNFGQGDGGASKKLDTNGRTFTDTTIKQFTIRGWIGFEGEIEAFGYIMGFEAPVFKSSFMCATEGAVKDAGGDFASRFEIKIPVEGVKGENKIVAVVKLKSGDIVKLDAETSEKANTEIVFVGETGAATYHGASFDTIWTNDDSAQSQVNFGKGDGSASDKLDSVNRTINGADGSIEKVTLRGWIGFEEDLSSIGYKIGENDPVFNVAQLLEAEDAVKLAGNGGDKAWRFQVTIPVADLEGTNEIVLVAKVNGNIVKLDSALATVGQATCPNTSFTYVGPAPVTPPTADASLVIFALAACAIALVVLKKKAF